MVGATIAETVLFKYLDMLHMDICMWEQGKNKIVFSHKKQ
jgi:hypothetical protein